MVIALIIAALVVAGIWFRMDFKVRYYKEASELYQGLYENEQDWRIDTEVALKDAQAHVTHLIANNAQQWASEQVKKVH